MRPPLNSPILPYPVNPPFPAASAQDPALAPTRRRVEIGWLMAVAFIALAVPKARIQLGPFPLHVVDVLLAGLLLMVYRRPFARRVHGPVPALTGLFLVTVLMSEVYGAVTNAAPIGPLYMAARFALAISLAWIVPKCIESRRDLDNLCKAVTVAVGVNAAIAIGYVLPGMHNVIASTVFAIPGLDPSTPGSIIEEFGIEYEGIRTRTLVGNATFTTPFLTALWPMAFLVYRSPATGRYWKIFALGVAIFAPVGALFTHSRMAWVAVLLVVSGVAVSGYLRGRRFLILAGLVVFAMVAFAGWDARWFGYERVSYRTREAIEDPHERWGDEARMRSYVEPFEHVVRHPTQFLWGYGQGLGKMQRCGALDEVDRFRVSAIHSVFAAAYSGYGMIGAFAIVVLMLWCWGHTFRSVQRARRRHPAIREAWEMMMLAWLGFIPWWFFGHGGATQARGMAMVFFLVGLMLAIEKIEHRPAIGPPAVR